MNKPIVAVDCDDVLVPNFEVLIKWYNQEYGTGVTLAHNNGMDPKPWGTDSIQVAIKRVQRFFETDEFKSSVPFDEAVQALRQLSEHFTLILVTARDEIIEEVTREWLERHFQGIFSSAHFTMHYNLDGKKRSKAKVAVTEGAEYLIDDTPAMVNEAARAGVRGVLFGDYPWNRADKLLAGVTRCKDWAAVLEYFDGR